MARKEKTLQTSGTGFGQPYVNKNMTFHYPRSSITKFFIFIIPGSNIFFGHTAYTSIRPLSRGDLDVCVVMD
tara:strand:- start:153 stop:368 length:216 start_codon:yes stop_codon:yes gene_type:complete